jgi:hypothetical protein
MIVRQEVMERTNSPPFCWSKPTKAVWAQICMAVFFSSNVWYNFFQCFFFRNHLRIAWLATVDHSLRNAALTLSRTELRNKWQYWIIAAVYCCCSWCTAWSRHDRNYSCFVARWALVIDKHFMWPEILLPVSTLLPYSALSFQVSLC